MATEKNKVSHTSGSLRDAETYELSDLATEHGFVSNDGVGRTARKVLCDWQGRTNETESALGLDQTPSTILTGRGQLAAPLDIPYKSLTSDE